MTAAQLTIIHRILHLVHRGTIAQIEKFEREQGHSLSYLIDLYWDVVADAEDSKLEARLERAFNKLTGR
jgi:siroheme synthase (precorrin-2 oxidase/ferrochelatase)